MKRLARFGMGRFGPRCRSSSLVAVVGRPAPGPAHGAALRRNRGFAAATIITLALGIGANAAIFSVVYAALLQPLRYAEPDQIFSVETIIPGPPGSGSELAHADPGFSRVARRGHGLLGGCRADTVGMESDRDGRRAARRRCARVGQLLAFLGVPVAFGRGFRPEEEQPGRDRVVVISDALWRSRHGGSPAFSTAPIF